MPQCSCCHPGCLALCVTLALPRYLRLAPLSFYWIPTYCLISVYRPVRAVDQFNHWLNSTLHHNQQWYAASCAMLYSYVMYNQLWCEGVRPAPLSCKQLIPSCAILYNQLWCAGVQPAARPAVVQSADPQLHYLI